MPRQAKVLPGPSRLSVILKSLNQTPKPTLATLKGLSLTLAARNDHFGARHFLKEDLPRIRFANPDLNIQINRLRKVKEVSRAEMQLEFKNGNKRTLELSQKWSTGIFEELMDAAGGERWRQYREQRKTTGQEPATPVVTPKKRPESAQDLPRTKRGGIASVLP